MSAEYEGQDPLQIAQQAERDLNSNAAKTGASTESQGNRRGHGASDSTAESGVDQSAENKFPGSTVNYGSGVSGAGDNREIPVEEGGDVNPDTGKYVAPTLPPLSTPPIGHQLTIRTQHHPRLFKAKDYEGIGGPEDKAQAFAEAHGGDNAVRGNIRQQGESGALVDEAREGPSGQPVSASGPGYTSGGAGTTNEKHTGYSGTGP
ncbi:hypothetical protein LTR53_011040 [Teratosphaeriaceae sp. CCFEE 6253]|nr:hypothetical protein LTR53_011040 [Teratosphaeriaceae sp. CCFEE 6253]